MARRPSDFFAVFLMDQGRGRSVAPTRLILRPQTRYKGRGISPRPSFLLVPPVLAFILHLHTWEPCGKRETANDECAPVPLSSQAATASSVTRSSAAPDDPPP